MPSLSPASTRQTPERSTSGRKTEIEFVEGGLAGPPFSFPGEGTCTQKAGPRRARQVNREASVLEDAEAVFGGLYPPGAWEGAPDGAVHVNTVCD